MSAVDVEDVHGGQPLKISAREWNSIRRLAKRLEFGVIHQPSGDEVDEVFRASLDAAIVNGSGSTVQAFGVLAITGATNEFPALQNAANASPALSGATPSKVTDLIGIVQDQVLNGGTVRAIIAGYAICTIDIKHADHKHAFPNASLTKLTSASVGPVRIVAKASAGTGDKVCLVYLQTPGEHKTRIKVTSDEADANGDFPALERILVGDGTRSDGAVCRARLATDAGDSVVEDGYYEAVLYGTSIVSGTPYVLYEILGNDDFDLPDCDPEDDETEGYRTWKFPHPTERGDFVEGDPP